MNDPTYIQDKVRLPDEFNVKVSAMYSVTHCRLFHGEVNNL